MQKSSAIIFVVTILVVVLVFGIAIWGAKRDVKKEENENQLIIEDANPESTDGNLVITDNGENHSQNTGEAISQSYVGTWYVSQLNYDNANSIKDAINKKENGEMSEEDYEQLIQSDTNGNSAILNVKSINGNSLVLDFTLEGPAPSQKIGEIKDITVEITNGIGTFVYTDNWGTEGTGTIELLEESKIKLKLETTKAAEGALWGIEGSYELTYKI